MHVSKHVSTDSDSAVGRFGARSAPLLVFVSITAMVVGGVTLSQRFWNQPHAIGPSAAVGTCQTLASSGAIKDFGTVTGVAAGGDSTVSAIADWQESRAKAAGVGVVSSLRGSAEDAGISRNLSQTEALTVCVFRGEFRTPTGPPNPDGSVKPPHNLLRVLVTSDKQIIVDAAGYEGEMSPLLP